MSIDNCSSLCMMRWSDSLATSLQQVFVGIYVNINVATNIDVSVHNSC